MTISMPEDPKTKETITRPTNNGKNIIDILAQAEKYKRIFNKNFQIKEDAEPSKLLDSLILYIETITPASIKNLPFVPKKIDDFFNFSPIEFISYLETLSLDQNQKQKIIRGWLENRIIQVYGLKLENISYDKTKIYQLKKENRLIKILKEIQEIGSIEDWDTFYRFGERISEIENIEEINIFEKNLESLKITLSSSPENQEKIFNRLKELAEEKRKLMQKKQEKKQQKEEKPKKLTKEERKQMIIEFSNALTQTLEYLRWAYSLKGKKMPRIVEFVLKVIDEYRNFSLTNTPETFRLAQLFWILRLNRIIDFRDFPPDVSKRIKRFFRTILDHSLLSESAGFWLEKNISIPSFQIDLENNKTSPSLKSLETIINSLILTIQSLQNWKNRNEIRININFDDKYIYKLIIKINSEKPIEEQLEEIKKQIKEQIEKQKENPIKLSENLSELYHLKQQAYQYAPINQKSRDFKQAFGHEKEIVPFLKTTENDDFAIRINLDPRKKPRSSPYSLFMVEHHQALINFDLYDKGIKISGKFAHRHFDGIPAKDFFKQFIKNLQNQFEQTEELSPQSLPEYEYNGEFPIFEASKSTHINDVLSEKISGFNPTFIYSLALAIANDIDNFHFLVNGPDIFSKYGPYSNVQPALILLEPIKQIIDKIKNNEPITQEDKQKVREWAEKIKEEIERAKKGLSTPAVIASVVGTKTKFLSKIAQIFHPGTNALIASGGMFSAIPNLEAPSSNFDVEQLIFYTAKSDVYHQKINMKNTPPSMGVIGFNQSQAKKISSLPEEEILQTEIIFTVRKNPSQAQRELKQWFEENFEKFNPNSKLSKKFEQLIKDWDKLTQGQIKLERYFSSLEDFFNSIPENKRKQLGLENVFQIQIQLNQILYQSAQNSISQIQENIAIAESLLKLAL